MPKGRKGKGKKAVMGDARTGKPSATKMDDKEEDVDLDESSYETVANSWNDRHPWRTAFFGKMTAKKVREMVAQKQVQKTKKRSDLNTHITTLRDDLNTRKSLVQGLKAMLVWRRNEPIDDELKELKGTLIGRALEKMNDDSNLIAKIFQEVVNSAGGVYYKESLIDADSLARQIVFNTLLGRINKALSGSAPERIDGQSGKWQMGTATREEIEAADRRREDERRRFKRTSDEKSMESMLDMKNKTIKVSYGNVNYTFKVDASLQNKKKWVEEVKKIKDKINVITVKLKTAIDDLNRDKTYNLPLNQISKVCKKSEKVKKVLETIISKHQEGGYT